MLARIAFFTLLVLTVGVIAGGSVYFLLTSTNPFVDIEAVMAPEVEVSARSLTLSLGDDGRQSMRLTAARADFDREANVLRLDDVRVVHYLRDGEELVVTAPRGEASQADKSVRLWPDAVVSSGETRMTCEEIVYDGKSTLEGRGDVVIRRGGVRMDAPVVFYDLARRSFRAENGVVLTTQASR